MSIAYEMTSFSPTLIFALTDVYLRERGTHGLNPLPMGPVKFIVQASVQEGIRKDFDTPLELVVQRNDSGYHLFFGKVKLSEHIIRNNILSEGAYIIRVESRFYQRFESEKIELPNPREPCIIDLEPGYAYPFPADGTMPISNGPTLLRGGVYQTDGQGTAGVVVHVPGRSNTYRTDETGHWVLAFPADDPGGHITVRLEYPDGTIENVSNVMIQRGCATSLHQTAIRGRVTTEKGVGLRDATIRVGGYPGRTTTDTNGEWLYYFGINQPGDTVDVVAELADGRSLIKPNVQVQHQSTAMVPVFRFQ